MAKTLKVALVGLGGMGRGHADIYRRYEKEGFPVQLVAVCDVNPDRLKGIPAGQFNLDVGADATFDDYRQYTDFDELLEKETDLDYVDIVLPTYLHCPATVKALNKGFNVFCEKPMALDPEQCRLMIDTAKKNGKKLMIGQCLRFWPEYEYLKAKVVDGTYGKVNAAYFFRGGGTPIWSFEDWLRSREKGGGALHDQHVHDTDMVNWLFGMPEKVVTSGITVFDGSGYDAVSTNYYFADGKVINAQDDWTINGDFGFEYNFRVNFERGALVYEKGKLTEYPFGGKAFEPVVSKESAYYRELVYFADCIRNDRPVEVIDPESCLDTIKIVHAETESADNHGTPVSL